MQKESPKKLQTLSIEATARFEPLTYDCQGKEGIAREYDRRNNIHIAFFNNKEDGERDYVAKIELRVCDYPDAETMFDVADENADSFEAAGIAGDYIALQSDPDKEDIYTFGINVCEIHTLYISPSYRGSGLSKHLFLMIPELLGTYTGREFAIFTIYVNPFKEQADLSESECEPEKYGYADNEADKHLLEVMRAALISAGFVPTDDTGKRYAADADAIRLTAEKAGINANVSDYFSENDVFY